MNNEKQLTAEQIRKVKDNNLIENVIGRHVDLKPSGTSLKGLCPFHDEKTPSFVVSPSRQMYKCFGCGAGGDVIEFVQEIDGCSFVEAVEKLGGQTPINNNYQKQKTEVKPTWQPLPFAPKGIDLPTFEHYKHGQPSEIYHYKDKQGQTVGFVCRYDMGQGKKEILPCCYAQRDGRKEWRFMGFGKPRPLLNLDVISTVQDMPIMLVEGEKTANAVNKFFGDSWIGTTWIGGVNGVKNADFTPLQGRTVLVCPDNDAQGRAAMDGIMRLLNEMGCEIYYFDVPSSMPDKWDIADFKGDRDELYAIIDENTMTYEAYLSAKNVPSVEVSKTETEVPKTDGITLETLKAFEFDPFEEYTAPDYLVKIHTDRGITNIGGKGCIITASGKHKSGKSFYASQFAVSALTRKICLGIEFDLRGKSVLYIDTEQPKFHFLKAQHFIRNQIQKLGGDANNYKALALRPLGKLERLEYVKAAFNIYKNLGLVIIDGLVDLINDYNDNKESSELLTTIMQLAEKSGAVIVQLLHVSKSTGRLRGHLGTEADNKSDCIIELAFDESTGLFNVSCKALRGSYPFASYEFIRDEKTGIPSLTNEDIDQQPPTYLRQANYDDFVKVVENNSNDFNDIPF